MSASAPNTPSSITDYRLSTIEQTLRVVSENLERLAAIEQRHIETREAMGRLMTNHDKLDDRVRSVELEMPTLKLIRGWVIAGVIGCAALLGLTLFKIATIPPTPVFMQPQPQGKP